MSVATVAPERSYEQRMAALRKANRIRVRRAVLKRDAKGGRLDVLDVLSAPPEFVDSMKVFDLLVAMPKVGRVKADKVLRVAGVSPSKTVGGLSPRQRRDLVRRLARSAW